MVRYGITEMYGTTTRTAVYCDCCNKHLGDRRTNKDAVWYDYMDDKWEFCPYCGAELLL